MTVRSRTAAWIILATVTIVQQSVTPNLILQLVVGVVLVAYGWSRYSKQKRVR